MKKRTPDLRKLARRQRWMLWLVLMAIANQFLPVFSRGGFPIMAFAFFALFHLACTLAMMVGAVLLLTAQGSHPVVTVLCGILMVAPCGNFLLLLLINMSVTRTLRRAGLRVGLMGVNPEEVERIINPDLCDVCGYNLTGNVTGICSECGTTLGVRNATS